MIYRIPAMKINAFVTKIHIHQQRIPYLPENLRDLDARPYPSTTHPSSETPSDLNRQPYTISIHQGGVITAVKPQSAVLVDAPAFTMAPFSQVFCAWAVTSRVKT